MSAEAAAIVVVEPKETEPISFEARGSLPYTGPLQMPLEWARPVFTAVDGIGEMDGLSVASGQVLALGHFTDEGPRCIGSGIMVGPGLLLTATHVLDEIEGKKMLAFSFVEQGHMRLWALYSGHAFRGHVESIPGQLPRFRRSDVAVVSCLPASEGADQWPLVMGEVELAIPRIGERLWTVGYREETGAGNGVRMTMLCSSGRVTAYLLDGRGNHLPGPVVEVAMDAHGGMSGGPVFNDAGHVVGVVSSSIGWEGGNGPTYVSLVWSAVPSEVSAPWPQDYWPEQRAGIQLGAGKSLTRLRGSTHFEGNVLKVRLADKGRDYILERLGPEYSKALEENRKRLAEEGDDHFYQFLEEQGEEILRTLSPTTVVAGISDRELGSLLARALKFEAECYEGCEDLTTLSLEMLEDGNLSVDVTFNLRRLIMTATLNRFDYEDRRGEFEASPWFWETHESVDSVDVVFGVRAYFRAGFTFSPTEEEGCRDFIVYAVRLRT